MILAIQTLESYLKLSDEYELHILPSTKFSAAKDHGENYGWVRSPLVRHILPNCLFIVFVLDIWLDI